MTTGERATRRSSVRRPTSRRALQVAGAAGALYLALTLLVAAGVADPVDAAVREWFRPDDIWGPTQLRADVVVEGLRPERVGLILPLVATSAAVVGRSWTPVRVALLVGFLSAGLVILTKLVVGRPDTHGIVGGSGGSYPSGHLAILLAVLGGCLLAIGTTRWWAWSVLAAVVLLMGVCLLLQAAHWFTDVLGGALLSTCVLAAVIGAQRRGVPELTGRSRATRPGRER